MRKARKIIVLTLVSGLVLPWNAAHADEIAQLRGQIAELRQLYEMKINDLQKQIDTLRASEVPFPAKGEKQPPRQDIYAQYVGRYEGPFQKGGLLVKNPMGFGDVSVGGYADIEYENFQNRTSTFDQHRYILNVGAEMFDRIRFYSEYEIEHGGPNAAGGGEAKVEQAWIDYLIADWINFRGGALLVPFGRYNLYHDSDLQDLTDRPIVARRIIPTTWTESGAGFYGEANPIIGDYGDLMVGYEAYLINGLTGVTDRGFRSNKGSIEQDSNQNKAIVGRVVVSPFLGHELGGSYYFGEHDNAGHYITGGAVDWFSSWDVPADIPGLRLGPVELVGEYAYFNIDEPNEVNVAELVTGGYAQINIHFWPEILDNTFLGRNFENPTFTLVGRYGAGKIDDDNDVGVGPNVEQRLTLGINYRPVESWVFKLEAQFNQTDGEPLEKGNDSGVIGSVAMGF